MASFNKVILMGNLTRDPELRVTAGGASICKFGIAVSRSFKTQDGTQKEETTFVDVDAFGRQGEAISKYMAKGRPIMLEGRLRLDQWESKTGEKRSKISVTLETFQFVGSRADNAQDGAANPYENSTPKASATRAPEPQAVTANSSDDFDEDVPF